MIALRAAKVVMVAAIALFASLVAFGNLTDYNTNFVFVEHVLSMDTIFPFSTIKYRAITNPTLHQGAYAVIDRRRMVRHVAVAAMERRSERVPFCCDDYRGADFRGNAGSGARSAEGRVNEWKGLKTSPPPAVG